ncbi:CRAL/TRIO domain-containing protein [Meira miltonrushii]|uniref:CRAL/TRIO domain-containing protein n=1 Tax=Meira miltonrushii TaxID=1280837 RepID=A0A316VG52_9BASI|nr:CRAL/TRIO domain-containing protein [Meira miltonrushii]PWN36506.1 CRAL/TRIO domain-containing protein [Meira miltonrushii]
MSSSEVKTKVVIPQGWHGNLNESQQTAYNTFKQKVEADYGSCSSNETWFDEVTLLRFLRARKFDVEKAIEQFSATDSWRKEINLEHLFRTCSAEELAQSRRHYPRFLGRRDKHGRPIFVLRPGSLDSERQKEMFSIPPKRQFERIAILTELMVRLWLPMASFLLAKEHPVKEDIVDLGGASLGMMWTLRNHLKQASVLNSAHYPETLGTLALVNVPTFFTTLWGWIQKWFDEGTRNKMFIVDANQLKQGKLHDIIHPFDLPKVYGGELEWQYEDEPSIEQEIASLLGAKEAPDGPAEWKDGQLILFDASEKERFPDAMVGSQ